jgi:L-serine dehydratase
MVSLLDVIGPVMVGPSSSHTAGACRIALLARALLGQTPSRAVLELHGSFAKTGSGHGTDRALVAGLLGMQPDDPRLRDGLLLAEAAGMVVEQRHVKLRGAVHPNSVRLTLQQTRDPQAPLQVVVVGSSLGGGRVVLTELDGLPIEVSGHYDTLVIQAEDRRGTIGAIATELARAAVNIATVRLSRRSKGGVAVHVYELDEAPADSCVAALAALPGVQVVRRVPRVG